MTDLPTTEELAGLDTLIALWEVCQTALVAAQDNVKRASAEIAKIETDLIPSLMASAGGIEKFTLANGTAITLKDELTCTIGDGSRGGPDNRVAAFAWLEENGHADVIKDELKVSLGKGDIARLRAEALIVACEQNGVDDYSRKRAVHPATLQALLKEQLAEGVDVPKETFGVFQQRRAIIKLAKGAK